jgi:opacity protein-like surface antigen
MNRSFLLVAALAVFAAPAFATPVTVNVNPGYAIPLGAAKDVTKSAFMIQGSAEIPVANQLNAGLELGYTNPNFEGSTALLGSFTSDINLRVLQITPFVRYMLPAQNLGGKSVTPYGVLGVGVYSDKSTSGTVQPSATAVPESASVTHFGLNVGIGASVDLAANWALGIDLRYHHYFTHKDIDLDAAASTDHEAVQFFVPSLRISYKFGS